MQSLWQWFGTWIKIGFVQQELWNIMASKSKFGWIFGIIIIGKPQLHPLSARPSWAVRPQQLPVAEHLANLRKLRDSETRLTTFSFTVFWKPLVSQQILYKTNLSIGQKPAKVETEIFFFPEMKHLYILLYMCVYMYIYILYHVCIYTYICDYVWVHLRHTTPHKSCRGKCHGSNTWTLRKTPKRPKCRAFLKGSSINVLWYIMKLIDNLLYNCITTSHASSSLQVALFFINTLPLQSLEHHFLRCSIP